MISTSIWAVPYFIFRPAIHFTKNLYNSNYCRFYIVPHSHCAYRLRNFLCSTIHCPKYTLHSLISYPLRNVLGMIRFYSCWLAISHSHLWLLAWNPPWRYFHLAKYILHNLTTSHSQIGPCKSHHCRIAPSLLRVWVHFWIFLCISRH